MEPSWTPNGLLFGLPLENAVSLGNITIPILKIRFCCILGGAFSIHFGVNLSLMSDLASGVHSDAHFSDVMAILEANLGVKREPERVIMTPKWGKSGIICQAWGGGQNLRRPKWNPSPAFGQDRRHFGYASGI